MCVKTSLYIDLSSSQAIAICLIASHQWFFHNIDSTPSAHFETTQLTLARRLRSTLSSGLSRIASIVFSYDHLDTNDDSDLVDHTVEPLHNGHLWEQKKVAVMGK